MKFRPNLSAPVVPLGPLPRLPSVPIEAYDGPVAPVLPPEPLPRAGFGKDSEVWTQAFPFPYPENIVSVGGGGHVFTTLGTWRACDVYISIPALAVPTADPLQGAVVSIYVHAVAGSGARTLVSTGRWRQNAPNPATGAGVLSPEWICAARSVQQQFQVSIGVFVPAAVVAATMPPIVVTVVASNQAVDPPPLIGAMRTGNGLVSSHFIAQEVDLNVPTIAGEIIVPQPELVGIQAVNGAGGAARYLMYFETNLDPLANGSIPQMIWPLGDSDGDGVVDFLVRWRAQNNFMRLRASSTPFVLTTQTDCPIQAFVR